MPRRAALESPMCESSPPWSFKPPLRRSHPTISIGPTVGTSLFMPCTVPRVRKSRSFGTLASANRPACTATASSTPSTRFEGIGSISAGVMFAAEARSCALLSGFNSGWTSGAEERLSPLPPDMAIERPTGDSCGASGKSAHSSPELDS